MNTVRSFCISTVSLGIGSPSLNVLTSISSMSLLPLLPCCSGLRLPLHGLFPVHGLLEAARPVGQGHTVKVIDLVLQDNGQESIGINADFLAVTVHGLDLDPLLALDLHRQLGATQAPFLALDFAIAFNDLRVDQ